MRSSDSHRVVSAIVVTYRPAADVPAHVAGIAAQANTVFVVDNGSGMEFQPVLANIQTQANVRLIQNPENLGIAAALNTGIRAALSEGYPWVATFDQDSVATEALFENQFRALEAQGRPDDVALISCQHATQNGMSPQKSVSEHITVSMTSGSLIRSSIFKEVGLYDESLFIDYVDFDFCLRLQKAGHKIIRAPKAILHHRLGTSEEHSFLWKKITIKTHSAWRHYYIMRNRVLMYRRYGFDSPLWCLHDLAWLGLDLAKIILFENGKCPKLFNVMKGIAHGIAGKTGTRVIPA